MFVHKRLEEPNRPIETSGIKMEDQQEHDPLIIYYLSIFNSPAGQHLPKVMDLFYFKFLLSQVNRPFCGEDFPFLATNGCLLINLMSDGSFPFCLRSYIIFFVKESSLDQSQD